MAEKIVIVDDEKEIADVVELYLKNEDYEVHKFYNGKDTLAFLEKRRTGSGHSRRDAPGH